VVVAFAADFLLHLVLALALALALALIFSIHCVVSIRARQRALLPLPTRLATAHAFERLGRAIARERAFQVLRVIKFRVIRVQLGISQQTINSYEVGRRRIPVSALQMLARSLGVSLEELLGEEDGTKKRGPTPKLQQQIERILELPRSQQRFVMQMLDTVLAQHGGR